MAPDSAFGVELEWYKARIKHYVDEGYNWMSIDASDPEALKGVDADRIQRDDKVYSAMSKPLDDNIMASVVQWTVASVPVLAWAKKVFADARDDEAMEKMWEAIFHAARVDDGCAVENWRAHSENLAKKAKKLMDLNFKSLHFKNSLGTDLVIALPDGHIWTSCGEMAKTGNVFIANIPTEEIFTAPHRLGTNGVVYATKPLVYMGDIIDKFWFKFKNGRVVDFGAEKNQDLLEKLLTTHENADYLGEVALVPHSSPISQSGILWYNTLFDENSSCHLALGCGYADTLKGAAEKSDDERMEMGLNYSLAHEDFMIGSDCMDIFGITADGSQVQIFKQGEWAI
jgi:aminopeptidase